jgi:hypothetical protein
MKNGRRKRNIYIFLFLFVWVWVWVSVWVLKRGKMFNNGEERWRKGEKGWLRERVKYGDRERGRQGKKGREKG